MSVIQVSHLVKRYSSKVAVKDLSFTVQQGEIFGILGPNGAGKTSTVECIGGLLRPDRGKVSLWGKDPCRDHKEVKQRLGIQLQQAMLPERLKVWEALDLYASFYNRAEDWHSLLEVLHLAHKRNNYFGSLSGGEKQRLFVALALVHDPELLLLDELTTGLDPEARRDIWSLIQNLTERGKTIVLTTHFMEEAEYLCDRIAFLQQGHLTALGTPEELLANFGQDHWLSFETDPSVSIAIMEGIPGIQKVERQGHRIKLYGRGDRFVQDVLQTLTRHHLHFQGMETGRPSLDDLFTSMNRGMVAAKEGEEDEKSG